MLRYFECFGLCSKSTRYAATLKVMKVEINNQFNKIIIRALKSPACRTSTYFVSELNPLRGMERFLVLPECGSTDYWPTLIIIIRTDLYQGHCRVVRAQEA